MTLVLFFQMEILPWLTTWVSYMALNVISGASIKWDGHKIGLGNIEFEVYHKTLF